MTIVIKWNSLWVSRYHLQDDARGRMQSMSDDMFLSHYDIIGQHDKCKLSHLLVARIVTQKLWLSRENKLLFCLPISGLCLSNHVVTCDTSRKWELYLRYHLMKENHRNTILWQGHDYINIVIDLWTSLPQYMLTNKSIRVNCLNWIRK